eukprot:272049-Prorocentrum_minimum.AAC.1
MPCSLVIPKVAVRPRTPSRPLQIPSRPPPDPLRTPSRPPTLRAAYDVSITPLKQADGPACDVSRAQGKSSGREWGTGQGGEKKGRGAMGVECTLAVLGTGRGPVNRSAVPECAPMGEGGEGPLRVCAAAVPLASGAR